MISRLFSFILILAIFITGCDDTTFAYSDHLDSQIDKVTFCPPDIGPTIPGTMSDNMSSIMGSALDNLGAGVESEAKKRDVWPVDTIYLKTLTLSMKSIPESLRNDNTLGFLSGVKVYISSDGLEEKLLAEANNIPENTTKINFTTKSVNIKPYLDKGMTTRTSISPRYCPSEDIPTDTYFKVEVGF